MIFFRNEGPRPFDECKIEIEDTLTKYYRHMYYVDILSSIAHAQLSAFTVDACAGLAEALGTVPTFWVMVFY